MASTLQVYINIVKVNLINIYNNYKINNIGNA